MSIDKIAAIFAVSMALSAPVWAADSARTRTRQIDALEYADARLEQNESGAGKPAQAQQVRQQRQTVQELLGRLEAGHRVDPADVEHALHEAERPF